MYDCFLFQSLKAHKAQLTPEEDQVVGDILTGILYKTKYDASHNFEAPGEDEALFMDFRSHLKVLFDSLTCVSLDRVLAEIERRLTTVLGSWRDLHFAETELALSVLYNLGEALPEANHFKVGCF